MNKKLEKLSREKVCSGFERLNNESLAMILGGKSTVEGTGGCSCGATGSSCGCSSTSVCNCPIIIEKPVKPIKPVVKQITMD